MNVADSPRPRRFQAPREDGQTLVDPPFDQVANLIRDNSDSRKAIDFDIQGRSYSSLAESARSDLIALATQYTRSYRDVAMPRKLQDGSAPILLSGHQPELFHPGVWFKNFALSRLAEQERGWAVHLIVDTDLCQRPAIRVPGGSTTRPTTRWIDFDRTVEAAAWEQRTMVDRDRLASFGRRVSQEIHPLVEDPMVDQFWPLVVARSREVDNLGACLSQARHQAEQQFGLETLELPVSQICRMQSFIWFTASVLARLPEVRQMYNESLLEYREVNRIRSRSHPVPELSEDDGWLEAPFWIFDDRSRRRNRMFVMVVGDQMVVSDRASIRVELPLSHPSEAGKGVERLREIAAEGIKIRPRALLTTMFARLFLSDLFIHGIGGAKYDELTDRLIGRMFGIKPPGYLTLTATLHLPIAAPEARASDVRAIERRLRDLRFNPERFLNSDRPGEGKRDLDDRAAALIERKRQWIARGVNQPQDRKANYEHLRQRHQEIEAVNHALQRSVAAEHQEAERQRERLVREIRANAILKSREYSFCLFPKKTLQTIQADLFAKSSVVPGRDTARTVR